MADAPPPSSPPPSDRDPRALRKRVGAWVKARRVELGLSQGAMIRELGYVSRNSVSNVETGREGLPPKRVHGWADLLQVPREAFFRFVTGETRLPEIDVRADGVEAVVVFEADDCEHGEDQGEESRQ